MTTILMNLLFAFSALTSWTVYCIASNYLIARKIGLPIKICPVDAFNPSRVFARPTIGPLIQRLPFGLGEWVRYSYLGWPWEHQYQLHARHGPAFTLVTPGEWQVIVGDDRAAADVLNRWKDFTKKGVVYAPFNVFGSNLITAEGEIWQRHRRITTPPFNERNNSLVWSESTIQAREMLMYWTTSKDTDRRGGIIKFDTSTLTLNVLSGAGFGKQQPFNSKYRKPDIGYELSFLDAIHTLTDSLFTTIVMSSAENVPVWLLPKNFSRVKRAIRELRKYMIEMVEAERTAWARGDSGTRSHNLMGALVRASEQAKLEQEKVNKISSINRRPWLSDDEIYGNLFIYNLAGHETTASALAYSISLLAANPDLQDWIGEEIQYVLGTSQEANDDSIPVYEEAFPRLKRCLGIMYESLRLYSPINGIPRWTGESTQTLKIKERTIILPPRTTVLANNAAAQTNPKIWGDDAHVWEPTRWISSGSGKPPLKVVISTRNSSSYRGFIPGLVSRTSRVSREEVLTGGIRRRHGGIVSNTSRGACSGERRERGRCEAEDRKGS